MGNMKLEDMAKKLFLLTSGISCNEDMIATIGHSDLDKMWKDLPQWQRDDYRFATEEFTKLLLEQVKIFKEDING